MARLIGYARVSNSGQEIDRQESALLAAGVLAEDLHVDRAPTGAAGARPALDVALQGVSSGDTLIVSSLDRLGYSIGDLLTLAGELRAEGISLRVLDLDGQDVDTATPAGSMVFTVLAGLSQLESALKRERVLDSVSKRRASGADLRTQRKMIDRPAQTSGQEPPEVAGGTHPPALHGLTMPIKRL